MSPAKGASKRSKSSSKASKSKSSSKAAKEQDSAVAMAKSLAGILDKHGLSEVLVERPDLTVRVRKQMAGAVASFAPAAAAPISTGREEPAAAAELVDGHIVTSPFVGTFYLAPNPDSAPYVSEGDSVSKGQVLCIVEAMKLMNEIEADVAGKVVEVLVKNAEPVEYGQGLFRIKPA